MKKLSLATSALAIIFAVSCGHGHHEAHDHDHHDHQQTVEKEHDHESDNEESHHGHGDEIALHDEVAERFGMSSDTVRIENFTPAIRVTGKIMPSASDVGVAVAPRAGVVRLAPGISQGMHIGRGGLIASIDATAVAGGDFNHAAKARLDAAKKEVERLRPLYADKLVTAAEYNAALAAYEQAAADYSPGASTGKVTAPLAGIITSLDVRQGQYVEAGTVLANISANSFVTIRFDVPHRYYSSLGKITDAMVFLPGYTEGIDLCSLGAKRLSENAGTTIDSNSSFIPVYFSVKNDGSLLPGMSLSAYLTSGNPAPVLAVPVSSLSEQQGEFFVYEKVHPEKYMKRPVRTGNRNGRFVEILSGIEKGKIIVVDGVTTVRLAETSAVAPQGHTHNH